MKNQQSNQKQVQPNKIKSDYARLGMQIHNYS